MNIGGEHWDRLLQHGHVIVPAFLSRGELRSAARGIAKYFPSDEERRATPLRYGSIVEDPEHLQIEFPFASDRLNDLSLDVRLLQVAREWLETDHVLLSQAALWAKYAGTGDFEQALHLDYEGNTLVVPRDDGSYRQLNMILYHSDVTLELGPTYVVSQEKTRDLPLWPTHRPRSRFPELYEHERPILANAGDLLIFSMRTWHRASAMLARTGARFTQHYIFRAAAHAFQGYHLWSQHGENLLLSQFIQRCTVEQRSALGFPIPSDPYWTAETRAAVTQRYPKLDMSPYHPKQR